jgi:AraC-like DNA-binding protein
MTSLTLDWLHVIVLLGAVQGLFLTAALFTKRRNRTANRLLAALMLAFSVFLAHAIYLAAGLVPRAPHFFGVAYPLPFLFGPLVFLYAVAAADRTRRFTARDALHLLPFVATVVAGLSIYVMSGPEKLALLDHLQAGGTPPLVIRVADPLKLISGVIYATLTILFLQRHREHVKASYSSTERVNLRWLLWLGGGAAAIWVMAVAFDVMGSLGVVTVTRSDDLVALGMAAMVYLIGYKGLRQPEIFRYETAEFPVQRKADNRTADSNTADSRTANSNMAGRYERSGLSDRDARKLQSALLDEMDRHQPWKNSELTLADLAERLGTTPHNLSEVLNSEIGQTFYDFVNGYRVREVQRRLAAGEGKALKLLSLALDAGFASKSTFNQVFKKHTSQTPSDYRGTVGV